MKRFAKPIAVMAIAASSVAAAVTVAGAVTVGEGGGCTPGYWKNHHLAWEEYTPDNTVALMLGGGDPWSHYQFSAELASLQGITMDEALNLGGGPGTLGAAQILLRAATASILNSAHESIEYPLRRFVPSPVTGAEGTVHRVRAVLDSGDRDAMLALATELDDFNNGECDLGGTNTTAGTKGKAKGRP